MAFMFLNQCGEGSYFFETFRFLVFRTALVRLRLFFGVIVGREWG
jgi:hypothetical protein